MHLLSPFFKVFLGSLAAVGLLALPAFANTPQSSSASAVLASPAAMEGLAAPLALRGQSRYSYFGFDVYDASLWAAPDFNLQQNENQVLALELHYLRAFQAKDIANRSLQEMRRSGSFTAAQETQWMEAMQRVFPNVRRGDRLLGLHRPGQSAEFWLNGQKRGEIRDPVFARFFFGIWLSPKTSEPALRQALIGPASPPSPSDQQVKAP